MQLGITIDMSGPHPTLDIERVLEAERLGFSQAWVGEAYSTDAVSPVAWVLARTTRIKQWRETLPNEVSHTTLDLVDNGFYDNTPVYQVPAGHYFMLGDNRDNAIDSRISAESRGVGYVPFQNLVGRVEIIFLSIDREGSGKVRSERLGMIVR